MRCEPLGLSRLCHCDCAYFGRMRNRHGRGFGPHVAIAIEQAAETVDEGVPACGFPLIAALRASRMVDFSRRAAKSSGNARKASKPKKAEIR